MLKCLDFSGGGIVAIATVLGISSPASAVIFAFESFINENEYSGTLEFSGEGSGLSPLFTDNTVLDTHNGNPDGTVYASAGGRLSPNAPTFDVTSTTLDVVGDFISGGMTFASGNGIVFADTGSSNILGDSATGQLNSVTFTPVDSTATSVPFEFSPALGLLAVGSIWGVSRLRKRAAASKITEDISA